MTDTPSTATDSSTEGAFQVSRIPETAEAAHWDNVWERAELKTIVPATVLASKTDPVSHAFYQRLGEVRGANVLDLGCGSGELSVLMALLGARVTAADTSAAAIAATEALAQHNGVAEGVRTHHGDLSSIAGSGQFDIVAGMLVLHHLDPFEAACADFDRLLSPNGRGVFLENNGRNPVLRFARRYIVGHFGIPKFGDDNETPFEPKEVELLRSTFGFAAATYPQLIFLRLISTYVYRYRPSLRLLSAANGLADDLLYRVLPPVRKYSYRQIVAFGRSAMSIASPTVVH